MRAVVLSLACRGQVAQQVAQVAQVVSEGAHATVCKAPPQIFTPLLAVSAPPVSWSGVADGRDGVASRRRGHGGRPHKQGRS